MDQPLRLNKFLAERLGFSRREADDLIASGKILVNGKPAILGARIDKTDKVCYNKNIVPFDTEFLYVAMNKPVGYVCSRRAQGSAPTMYELLPKEYQKLKSVGRLDKDSSGLILLTNDGDFAFQMTHPKFHKEKVYEVELDKPLEPLHQQMISDFGVMLDDGPSKFMVIKQENPLARGSGAWQGEDDDTRAGGQNASFEGHPEPGKARTSAPRPWRSPLGTRMAEGQRAEATRPEKEAFGQALPAYTVILTEGRNRQIRRTFAALGYTVTKLHRTQFGKYQLSGLKPGECVIIKPWTLYLL